MRAALPRSAAALAALLAAAGCDPDDGGWPDVTDTADTDADTVGEDGGPDPDGDAGPEGETDAPGDGPSDLVPVADGGEDGAAARVAIRSPADGAVVENPVTFVVEADGVESVRLFADDWPLGEAWDPAGADTLVYEFTGVGYERRIRLVGYRAGGEAASDEIRLTVTEPGGGRGDPVGSMWTTYYYFADEAAYGGADDTALFDSACREIARVPAEFSDDVCIEGSGRLEDGRVINYASSCGCGRPCPTGGIICYAVLDPVRFPWGMGSRGNALEPLRSWAVDNAFLPYGTVLYAEEWDGVTIPAVDGLGGFVHDGCFRADDVGGAIDGNHFDFFAGTAAMWRALEAIHPTRSEFSVFRDGSRCAHLLP